MPRNSNESPTVKEADAVVLLNFGGPRSLDEVPTFLYEILRDPNTIQLPFPFWLQNRLAKRISNKRAEEVGEQYEAMGGKSPIIEATEAQRLRLEESLTDLPNAPKVLVAHRYIPGDAEAIASKIVAQGIKNLLLIPLYPHYSHATTGSSVEQFMDALEKLEYQGETQAIVSYPNHPYFIDALCDRLKEGLSELALDPQKTRILCSAHGLPQSYVDKGDPYLMELYKTVEELRKKFPEWQFQMCFQSRVGPAKWLQPYTDEVIQQLPHEGVRSIVFLPISFVNDHLETIYEIGYTYFELAKSVNLEPHRIPAIESHPRFIEFLSEQVSCWQKGQQGVSTTNFLPPSQQPQRYDRWIFILWMITFLIALFNAIG